MPAKLLLIQDVDNLGRSGDIVTVKPGYSRYLLPQGFAVVADKRTIRMQARLKEERLKKAVADKQESDLIAKALEGIVLSIVVKVDHEGHMYGSVAAQDVVDLLHSQKNVSLEKRAVVLKHAIKELGEHKIAIKLKEGVTASILLNVEPSDPKFAVVKVDPALTAEPAEEASSTK